MPPAAGQRDRTTIPQMRGGIDCDTDLSQELRPNEIEHIAVGELSELLQRSTRSTANDGVEVSRRAPFVCVLLFPVGLVALAFRETQRIVVTFEEAGHEQTRITVQGSARRPVRKAFAGLSRATP
jgi:hypothetical protein